MAEQTALDILVQPTPWQFDPPAVVVLHGNEPFLVGRMLCAIRDRLCPDETDRDWAWREFAGDSSPDPRDVFDEAATVPLFAGATRAAVVRAADGFVSANRERLEQIAGTPRGGRGVVILEVRSFPATTRLAKAVVKHGLAIDASIPQRYGLSAWVSTWASRSHGVQLAAATSERLLERLGGDLGQVDQALARLVAAIDPAARRAVITPEAVDGLAATPAERTAWGMIDAAAAGDTPAAVKLLAELFAAGESPIAIAAQTATVLRRLSTAARLLARPATAGRPSDMEQALREAGVAAWPKAMAQARESLGQLGARRARRLPAWLLDLDLSLKGEAARGVRSRLAIERLFCRLRRSAGTATTPRGGTR